MQIGHKMLFFANDFFVHSDGLGWQAIKALLLEKVVLEQFLAE